MLLQPDPQVIAILWYRFTVQQIQHAFQICKLITPLAPIEPKTPSGMIHQAIDDDLLTKLTGRVRL